MVKEVQSDKVKEKEKYKESKELGRDKKREKNSKFGESEERTDRDRQIIKRRFEDDRESSLSPAKKPYQDG